MTPQNPDGKPIGPKPLLSLPGGEVRVPEHPLCPAGLRVLGGQDMKDLQVVLPGGGSGPGAPTHEHESQPTRTTGAKPGASSARGGGGPMQLQPRTRRREGRGSVRTGGCR